MFGVVIFRARHVILTIGLVGIFMSNATDAPNSVTVQDPRPVAKAIQELNKRYQWQITYEDLPLTRRSDLPQFRAGRRELCSRSDTPEGEFVLCAAIGWSRSSKCDRGSRQNL
jgi:hypothetical protein